MYNAPSGQQQAGWDQGPAQNAAYSAAPGMQGMHQPGYNPMQTPGQTYAPSTSYPVPQQQPAAYPPPPGYPSQDPYSATSQTAPCSTYPGAGSAAYQPGQAGPVDPTGQGEDSSRGLGTFMMNQGHSLAHAGRTAHFVAHPTEALQYHTTGKMKRKVHQAVGSVLNKVMPW